jgi:hypothetical protein
MPRFGHVQRTRNNIGFEDRNPADAHARAASQSMQMAITAEYRNACGIVCRPSPLPVGGSRRHKRRLGVRAIRATRRV